MPINVDYTLDKIIKEIQDEIREESGEILTYDTVLAIIEQQCKSTVIGMANGHTIVWKYFGNFVATKKRVDALNNLYERKGKTPTLVDNGFIRLSFKRNGEGIGETKIETLSKKDITEQGDYLK